jgi:hypothetical protein
VPLHGRLRRLRPLTGEQLANLAEIGEATFLFLREDQLGVRQHVVLALRALLDLGLVLGLGVQLGRETRGPRVVAVSDGAVLNQDAHHEQNLSVQGISLNTGTPEISEALRSANRLSG